MSHWRESRPLGWVTKTTDKNNLRSTGANLKQISNNFHGAQGFALLAHSLLSQVKNVGCVDEIREGKERQTITFGCNTFDDSALKI